MAADLATDVATPAAKLPVLFLMGTTASGKTDLAAHLYTAQTHGWAYELISVDAAQVFRRLDIGTAKPDAAFLQRFPHHLIDIRDPQQSYSVAEFRRDANRLIQQSHRKRKLPLFVGGTMFYFHALEHGLADLPATEAQTRRAIQIQTQHFGLAEMHRRLALLDARLAARISPTDPQRLQRALAIAVQTERPPSQLMQEKRGRKLAYPLIKLTLFSSDRPRLHQRIATRFDAMLTAGLLDEVHALKAQFADRVEQFACMRSVGYRQALAHINGSIDRQTLREQACAATRQLAKRQLTWLRQQANLVWFDAAEQLPTRAVVDYLKAHPYLYKSQAKAD